MVTKKGLLVDLLVSDSVHHQEFDIDDIRVKFHYNYLNNRYFISVYYDDAFIVSNRMVLPNIDLFKNLYNAESEQIGQLYFNTETEHIDKNNIDKVELIYLYPEV